MFQTLEVLIALSVVYLIFSMILKYLMTVVKRLLKTKANIVAKEMKAFFGEKTSEVLVPYIEKKAEDFNLLETLDAGGKKMGLRQFSKPEIMEVIQDFDGFLKEFKDLDGVKEKLKIDSPVEKIKGGVTAIRDNLNQLQKKIENNYNSTITKIHEQYEHKMRWYTLLGGILLAFVINADIFEIYHSLSKNALARTTIASQASVINKQMEMRLEQYKFDAEKGYENKADLEKETQENLNAFFEQIEKASLDLGWTRAAVKKLAKKITADDKAVTAQSADTPYLSRLFAKVSWLAVLKKLIGLLVSGLLISFGAPFWHDFLSAVTGLHQMVKGKAQPLQTAAAGASPQGAGPVTPSQPAGQQGGQDIKS